VIVATAGTPTIRAAKAATSTIPIVFVIGGDPVMFGLVASLNRPGGNLTGITLIASETVAKRLELLLELVPTAAIIGVLANLNNPITKPQLTELQAAVQALGRDMHVLNASIESDFETAFAAVDQQHVDALLVAADPFFDDRRAQLVALAARHKVPVSYVRRGPTLPTHFVRLASTLAVFSRAKSRLTCRLCSQQNSNWSSTSKPPRH
jgi:putative ABC transport system substrate-binding protein